MNDEEPPLAKVHTRRAPSLLWFVPMLALAVAGWLLWRAFEARGLSFVVQFSDGHGVEVGDALQYRGIRVGTVEAVQLSPAGDAVQTTVRLLQGAEPLAVGGSRFWVVRPEIGFSRISGLETVVGPRYLAVSPGHGEAQHFFLGLNSAPLVQQPQVGDLEVILGTDRRHGLVEGSPVLYREVRIGTVLSAALTSDGSGLEARLYIEKAYAPLIRSKTHFFQIGGIDAHFGLDGFDFDFESLESVLRGGVAVATPPDAGDPVANGYRFPLDEDPPKNWSKWTPLVALGDSHLPAGASKPEPLRAVLLWKETRFLRSDKERSRDGWVLSTEDGLYAPADLLRIAEKDDAEEGSVFLEIAGERLTLPTDTRFLENSLACTSLVLPGVTPWPRFRLRPAAEPEDCVAISDRGGEPLPLALNRLENLPGEARWRVDPAVPVEQRLHGAAVTSSRDGSVLGFLIVGSKESHVALLAPPPVNGDSSPGSGSTNRERD